MNAQKENRFAILLDGEAEPSEALKTIVSCRQVIAADGGIRHAQALGLQPDLWIGDFDSSDSALAVRFKHIERKEFPFEKAASDGELAIFEAIERGATDIVLVGALGGKRSDHVLFHVTKAISLAQEGIAVVATDGRQMASPLIGGASLKPFEQDDTTFSIVGFSALEGLTINEAKWPLNAVNVPLGSTLTLSNVGNRNTKIQLVKGEAILFTQLER
ncbi:MAG: thiamine diphosphokinase [Pseudomonadota bacterium]